MSIGNLRLYRADGYIRLDCIYVLACRDADVPQAPTYAKIGRTINPGTRVGELITGCPIPPTIYSYLEVGTEVTAIRIEKALHAEFKSSRSRGEWFRFPDSPPMENAIFMSVMEHVLTSHRVRNRHWTHVDVPELMKAQRQWSVEAAQEAKRKRREATLAAIAQRDSR